jgi:uncharacterized C2H2 Zn-finger protein
MAAQPQSRVPPRDATLFSEYVQRYLANDRVREWLLCREPEPVRHAGMFHDSLSYACMYYVPSKANNRNRDSGRESTHYDGSSRASGRNHHHFASNSSGLASGHAAPSHGGPPGDNAVRQPSMPQQAQEQPTHLGLPRDVQDLGGQNVGTSSCISSRGNSSSLNHLSTPAPSGPAGPSRGVRLGSVWQDMNEDNSSDASLDRDAAKARATAADMRHQDRPPRPSRTNAASGAQRRSSTDRYAPPAPFLDSGDLMMFHATHDNFAVGSLYTTREHHALAQLRDAVEETGLSTIPKSRRFASDLSVDALELMEFAWLMDDSLIVSCRKLQQPVGAPPEKDNMLAIQGDILFYGIIPKDQHPGTPLKRMRLFEKPVMCSCCGSRGFTQCTCPNLFKRRAPSVDLLGNPSKKLYKLAAKALSDANKVNVVEEEWSGQRPDLPSNAPSEHSSLAMHRQFVAAAAARAAQHSGFADQAGSDCLSGVPSAGACHDALYSDDDDTNNSNAQRATASHEHAGGTGRSCANDVNGYRKTPSCPSRVESWANGNLQNSARVVGTNADEAGRVGAGAAVDDNEDQLGAVVISKQRSKQVTTFANFTSRLFSIDQSGSFFVQWYVRVPNTRHMRSWAKPRSPIPYQFICGSRDQTNVLAALFISDMQICARSFQNDTRFYGSLTNGADIGMLVSKDSSNDDAGKNPLVFQDDAMNPFALQNTASNNSVDHRSFLVTREPSPVVQVPGVEFQYCDNKYTNISSMTYPETYQGIDEDEYQTDRYQNGEKRLHKHVYNSGSGAGEFNTGIADPNVFLAASAAQRAGVASDSHSSSGQIFQSPSVISSALQSGRYLLHSLPSVATTTPIAGTTRLRHAGLAVLGNDSQVPALTASLVTAGPFLPGSTNCSSSTFYHVSDGEQGPSSTGNAGRAHNLETQRADSDSDGLCPDAGTLSDSDLRDSNEVETLADREAIQSRVIAGADGTPTCAECGASFKKTGNLTRHIQTVHLKKKPFACDQCPASFGYKTHLNRHVQTVHNKSNDFKCSDCNREFRTQQQLDRHVQQAHSGASSAGETGPIKCETCGHGFSQRSNLNRHIQSIHEGMRHMCNACPSSFGQRFDLQRHVQRCAENGDIDHADILEAMKKT